MAQPSGNAQPAALGARVLSSDITNTVSMENALAWPHPGSAGHLSENSLFRDLMMAVVPGDLAAVKGHLQAGADSMAQCGHGVTPLTAAAMLGHPDIIHALVRHRATAQVPSGDVKEALESAVLSKHPAAVSALLEAGAPVDMALTPGGWTALTMAAHSGSVEVVRALVKGKANIHGNGIHISATMHAAYEGHFDVVQVLVQAGVDINAELLQAVEWVWPKMVTALCQAGADASYVTDNGYSVPMGEAQQGCSNSVLALAAANAQIDAGNSQGRTALMRAASIGRVDAIKALLHLKADQHAADSNGMTALMHATCRGKVEAVKLLAAENTVNAKSPSGVTALLLASQAGHADTIKVLTDSKADMQTFDGGGCYDMLIAAQNGHVHAIHALMQAGADINANLLAAVNLGEAAAVSTLLRARADANAADSEGATALMLAQRKAHSDIAPLPAGALDLSRIPAGMQGVPAMERIPSTQDDNSPGMEWESFLNTDHLDEADDIPPLPMPAEPFDTDMTVTEYECLQSQSHFRDIEMQDQQDLIGTF